MNRSIIAGIVGIFLFSGIVIIGSEDSSADSDSSQNYIGLDNFGTLDNPITDFTKIFYFDEAEDDYVLSDFDIHFLFYCVKSSDDPVFYVLKNSGISLSSVDLDYINIKVKGSIVSVPSDIPGVYSQSNELGFHLIGSLIEPGIYPISVSYKTWDKTNTLDESRSKDFTFYIHVVDFVFNSVPVFSNIVSPVYSYTDDGEPFIPSDDVQNLNSAAYPVLGSPATIGADKWVDPNYRDPPNADHIITVTAPLNFKSNDPAYTLRWTSTEVSGASDVDKARYFALIAGNSSASIIGGNQYKLSTGGVAPCLPSWITYETGSANSSGYSEIGWFDIIIRPALQQVSEDTHGDYWMYFETESPKKESWLIKLSVDVQWNGGVIVPEKYNEFILSYDYGIGGQGNFSYRQVVSDSTVSYQFIVPSEFPSRSGFEFRGWSVSPGSEYSDIGDAFVLSASTPGVSVKTIDNKTTYEKTIYGVWKEIGSGPEPIPDFLAELLELLRNPAVMGGFLVFVFLFALAVRSRRM